MSRKRSRSKENGFLAIPYSWNKLLGNNTSASRFVLLKLLSCQEFANVYLYYFSVSTRALATYPEKDSTD
jgi:hypothetical protein